MLLKHILKIIIVIICAISCKELPTFSPGGNDPNSPDYRVRPVKSFQIIRYTDSRNVKLFWQPDLGYPFDGAIIEMGTEKQFQRYKDVSRSQMENWGVFSLHIDYLPYLNTEFKVQMYHILDGDTLFSQPDSVSINQLLFDFNLEHISGDEYNLSWKNNYMRSDYVEIAKKLNDNEYEYIGGNHLSLHEEHDRTNSILLSNLDTNDINKLHFKLYNESTPKVGKSEYVPIDFSKNGCIQTINNKKFFVPDGLTFKFDRNAKEVTIDWTGNCWYSTLNVYWDPAELSYSSFIPEREPFLPMQKIHSTSKNSGEIVFEYNHKDDFRLWLTAVVDGVETELTLPSQKIRSW